MGPDGNQGSEAEDTCFKSALKMFGGLQSINIMGYPRRYEHWVPQGLVSSLVPAGCVQEN